MKRLFFLIILILLIMAPLDTPQAKVTGLCVNCHTMHNSQGGASMAYELSGGSFSATETPNAALVVSDCLGCHTAIDASTWEDPTTGAPIVYNVAEPSFNAAKGLAGGNFYWVKTDDTKGHNVFSDNPEDTMNPVVAPGKNPAGCATPTSCHVRIDNVEPQYGTRQGCTKCHMMGNDQFSTYHHADDSNLVVGSIQNDPDRFFRFLQGHMSGVGKGVSGIEDTDWEKSASASDHNEYLGNSSVSKVGQLVTPMANSGNTMTAFCCGCHAAFHEEQNASGNWIRHPSDTVLGGAGTEYAGYSTYNPLVPVARDSLSTVSSTVSGGDGDMVMCLSCHRAHGSPYDKMLRWDYKGWPAAGTNGCATCHTWKE